MAASGDAAAEGECNESLWSRAQPDCLGLGGHSADGKRRSCQRGGAASGGEGLELAGDALEDWRRRMGAGRTAKTGGRRCS